MIEKFSTSQSLVEIPWWDLIYGRYKETEAAYDDLYPAAAKLGVN